MASKPPPTPTPTFSINSRFYRLVLPAFLALSAQAGGPPPIRVSLYASQSSISVGAGQYAVTGEGLVRRVKWKNPSKVLITRNGFIVGKDRWPKKVLITPVAPGGVVVINKKPYRGQIELERVGPDLRVVNMLSVEDYVRGILNMETSEKWPEQALRAQAVISRTYALRNRGRHGRGGADFCATPHCQAYGGQAAERPATDSAVAYTRGQVLVDKNGRLISTVYHSTCGGETESAQNVWETGGQPYLRPVSCKWCKDTPHYRWTTQVTNDYISKKLTEAKAGVGTVRAIGILSHTPSGRVYRVRVYGSARTKDFKANRFRNIVDPRRIRSTYWAGVSRQGDLWKFHGRGWGHGVGLCQWGMKALAEKSMVYGQILRYYYRGVSVQDWKE